MIRIALVILLILAIAYFIRELKRQRLLSSKEKELENVEMESNLLDIDKEIAHERAYQDIIQKEISTITKTKGEKK